jgi:hypothetical protein
MGFLTEPRNTLSIGCQDSSPRALAGFPTVPSQGWSVTILPVRSTVLAPTRNRIQDHAFNTCVEPADPTRLQAPLATTPPHHLHGQARAESTPQSCSEFVYSPRRFRDEIARDEGMAFVAEISNQRLSGFQVESQECSTVNGCAGSDSRFGNPCRRKSGCSRCNRDSCLRRWCAV